MNKPTQIENGKVQFHKKLITSDRMGTALESLHRNKILINKKTQKQLHLKTI